MSKIEDYMKLPKKKLAELLVMRDTAEQTKQYNQKLINVLRSANPCYHTDGLCTNPLHDCDTCIKMKSHGQGSTSAGLLANAVYKHDEVVSPIVKYLDSRLQIHLDLFKQSPE